MAKVKRASTKPYCTCTGGAKGWTKHPGDNEYWVHPDCFKVSRLVFINHGSP